MEIRTLTAGLRSRPAVDPILEGRVRSSHFRINAEARSPYTDTFRAMIRELAYDIAEMPLATQVLAVEAGHPLVAMPIVLAGSGLPHISFLCRADGAIRDHEDLRGRRIGIRSYAQTTGVWVRGVLQNDFNVDLSSLSWRVLEDSHLKDFQDPDNVSFSATRSMKDMLAQDEVDAVVASPRVLKTTPGLRTVIPDAREAGEAWRRRHGVNTVNHVLAVRRTLAEAGDPLVGEIARLFVEARDAAILVNPISSFPLYGAAANQPGIDLMLEYTFQQGLTARRWTYHDLFLPWPEQIPTTAPPRNVQGLHA